MGQVASTSADKRAEWPRDGPSLGKCGVIDRFSRPYGEPAPLLRDACTLSCAFAYSPGSEKTRRGCQLRHKRCDDLLTGSLATFAYLYGTHERSVPNGSYSCQSLATIFSHSAGSVVRREVCRFLSCGTLLVHSACSRVSMGSPHDVNQPCVNRPLRCRLSISAIST